jgi:uncharacterized protein YecT (DUF1311 family)
MLLVRFGCLVLCLALASAGLAASPSFDCKTAKTARELATCNDAKLAAADRELAAAWQSVGARLDPATLTAMRKDQQKFLSDLNTGFDSSVWGKAGPPAAAAMRAQVARLKRDANDADDDPLTGLDTALRERIAFLRALTPASSVAGLWKNADAELLIVPAQNGAYQVTFGMTSYGFEKYSCHFSGTFTGNGDTLVAAAVQNADPDIDDFGAGTIRIARTGQILTINQPEARTSGAPWLCPRVPGLTGSLFHTGLTADQAYRLTPDN